MKENLFLLAPLVLMVMMKLYNVLNAIKHVQLVEEDLIPNV